MMFVEHMLKVNSATSLNNSSLSSIFSNSYVGIIQNDPNPNMASNISNNNFQILSISNQNNDTNSNNNNDIFMEEDLRDSSSHSDEYESDFDFLDFYDPTINQTDPNNRNALSSNNFSNNIEPKQKKEDSTNDINNNNNNNAQCDSNNGKCHPNLFKNKVFNNNNSKVNEKAKKGINKQKGIKRPLANKNKKIFKFERMYKNIFIFIFIDDESLNSYSISHKKFFSNFKYIY